MQTKHSQGRSISASGGVAGFSVWAVSINLLLLSMILGTSLKVVPRYMEYLFVKDRTTWDVAEYDRQTNIVTHLRTRLGKPLTTNHIYDSGIAEIAVDRRQSVVVNDASYEKRLPLSRNLDGVIVFYDLVAYAVSMSRT